MGPLQGKINDFNGDGYMDFLIELPDEHGYAVYLQLNLNNKGFKRGFCEPKNYFFDSERYSMQFLNHTDKPPEYLFLSEDQEKKLIFHNLSDDGGWSFTDNVEFVYDNNAHCYKRITKMIRRPRIDKTSLDKKAPWWKFWKYGRSRFCIR